MRECAEGRELDKKKFRLFAGGTSSRGRAVCEEPRSRGEENEEVDRESGSQSGEARLSHAPLSLPLYLFSI